MANMLKLVAVGNAPSKDKHSVESLVAAGLGYHAHVGIDPAAESKVIDESVKLESDVVRTAIEEFPNVVAVHIPHPISTPSHTWSQIEHVPQAIDHIAIPWLDKIDIIPTSLFQGEIHARG